LTCSPAFVLGVLLWNEANVVFLHYRKGKSTSVDSEHCEVNARTETGNGHATTKQTLARAAAVVTYIAAYIAAYITFRDTSNVAVETRTVEESVGQLYGVSSATKSHISICRMHDMSRKCVYNLHAYMQRMLGINL
jgi:hypothetical protein